MNKQIIMVSPEILGGGRVFKLTPKLFALSFIVKILAASVISGKISQLL